MGKGTMETDTINKGGDMKSALYRVSVVMLTLALFACGAHAASKVGKGAAAQPAAPAAAPTSPDAKAAAAFQASKDWNKLDPDVQAAYQGAVSTGDFSVRIDCFVRDSDILTDGDRSFLISNGFNVRTAAGNVATGYLKAGDLPSVASLPFVASIKAARK